jgi:predicted MFS family arabinose efflux permease
LTTADRTTGTDEPTADARWWAFAIVCSAYLMVAAGEALLAPIFPIAADDVGLDLALAGAAFAVLTGSTAAACVIGGMLLHRYTATQVIQLSLVLTSSGAVVAALSHQPGTFLVAQMLIGLGAGTFFPAGVLAAGSLSGDRHRGRALAVFGIAFSSGLTLGAVLAAIGDTTGWRLAFWLTAGMATAAFVAVSFVRDVPTTDRSGPVWSGVRAVIGLPTFVGSVAAVSHYGTVVFLPAFAVGIWGWSGGAAASLLAASRVLAMPVKLIVGVAADRLGPRPTAAASGLLLTATGLIWSMSPWPLVAAGPGIVFAATTSALFPLSNLMAYESFGRQGAVLGTFRAVQMGAGAVAGAVIGGAASVVGLRPVLATMTLGPLLLLVLARGHSPRSQSDQQLEDTP